MNRERLNEIKRLYGHDIDVLGMDDVSWLITALEEANERLAAAERLAIATKELSDRTRYDTNRPDMSDVLDALDAYDKLMKAGT